MKILLTIALPALIVMLTTFANPGESGLPSWQESPPPHMRINTLPSDRVMRFRSEQSADHFKLLDIDGDHLLIGAKNMVYNLSASTLQVRRRVEWRSSESDMKMCKLKGKSHDACQNYIRVVAKKSHNQILVCGTNSYKPKCRDYILKSPDPSASSSTTGGEFSLSEEKPGEGLCPYDPNHNSTFTFADGDLYVGTVGQFSGADPLIYRKPLRTEQFNLKHLNAPNFVSSMYIGSHVYFFFRESAVEYINCGKAIYSRVARVCVNDAGGPHKFKERFTSFLKARLNCSVPGEMPFYFDELQATSQIMEGSYNGDRISLIYAVLTTPHNSIPGSAVCAFRISDILKVFDGAFKGQKEKNSNWLPVINSRVPEPRPGQCTNSSRSLPDVTLNFITNHPLMDQAVSSYLGRGPVVVHTGFMYRYTAIAVDPQVEAANLKTYDVLFIGTDRGHVIKVINVVSLSADHQGPVVVEDVQVFTNRQPVTNLVVYKSSYEQKLIAVSREEVVGVPLFHCGRARTCGDCVRLQDPFCAWSTSERKCTHKWRGKDRHSAVQNIEEGWDQRCGGGSQATMLDTFRLKNNRDSPLSAVSMGNGSSSSSMSADLQDLLNRRADRDDPLLMHATGDGTYIATASSIDYTGETLAVCVTTAIVSSLVLGFMGGYIFGCRGKAEHLMALATDPEDYTRYMEIQRAAGGGGLLVGAPVVDLGVTYPGHELNYTLSPHHHLTNRPLPPPTTKNVNLILNKNGKPSNHLGTAGGDNPNANVNLASAMTTLQRPHQQQLTPDDMNININNTLSRTTTLQKVKKIYL
ncbi:semaphorin-1A-like isoform X2 [Varroa jacobsoni]|uniref:semaphorin-1A-like isoform X2 n=1 Tax=Varroa jacobsoni TaxID=62625 RepID=UPI000BF42E54|nr:semaphorin-1A-like isoform X2 [Varroa jacobsoni]